MMGIEGFLDLDSLRVLQKSLPSSTANSKSYFRDLGSFKNFSTALCNKTSC